MSVLQGSPSYRKSKKVTEEWRRPTLPAQNFSGKSPDLPLILENFRRGLSRKGVDCFVPYFMQICKDPGRVTFCFQCIDHLILSIINDVL